MRQIQKTSYGLFGVWLLSCDQGMKTKSDPRHQRRIHLMQQLFSYEQNPQVDYQEIGGILQNLTKIDEMIEKSAPQWPLPKINKVDLSILRLAIFELLFNKEVPQKVAIDEAVELAKEYGSESSPGFVNGVLGKVLEWMKR